MAAQPQAMLHCIRSSQDLSLHTRAVQMTQEARERLGQG